MIMYVYHVLIIVCVFYTLCPMSACSYIAHASHMHIRCTLNAHTLSLVMFCIHTCQLSLFRPLSPITCSCVYVMLVYFRYKTFFSIYSCLWTSLIKFVTMLVYGLCVCSFLQMSPRKLATKKSAKRPHHSPDSFRNKDANNAYFNHYKNATIIMDGVWTLNHWRTHSFQKCSRRGHGPNC